MRIETVLQKKRILIIWVLLLLTSSQILKAADGDRDIQTSIHLLDYIARDYPAAVQNGEIINQEEYEEMLEFSATVIDLSHKILAFHDTAKASVILNLQQLKERIVAKAPHGEIAALAKSVKTDIINITNFKVTPTHWPDLTNGQKLYTLSCTPCHGQGNGKGKLSVGMEPAPTNFLNDELMVQISPFQAYNTIRLGIGGTAMRGFEDLSEKEVWDLSFYIKSLRFKDNGLDSVALKRVFKKTSADVSLSEVVINTDQELLKRLKGDDEPAEDKLAALRLHVPDKNSPNFLQLAQTYLHESLKAYQDGSFDVSRQKALAAYLEGIEPVEAQLKAFDPVFTADLEQQMLNVRTVIENREAVNVLNEEVDISLTMISEAANMMKDTKLTFWLSFLLSASILLREGLEAFLIIAVMLTIVRSAGIKKALPWVHGGWIAAILLGLIGWHLSDMVLISGQNREILEGLIALLAVVILTYVGFWLHNNSHVKMWKAFIEEKVNNLVKAENMIGFAFFSFMVVFREAFESVLFLKAISLETAPENQASIGLGVIVAFIAIAILMILFIRYSKKIPIRQLFRYSAWIITLLALILIGKGVHSIQESGFFSATSFPLQLRVEWLGLYPTMESIFAQAVLLAVILVLWNINNARVKSLL